MRHYTQRITLTAMLLSITCGYGQDGPPNGEPESVSVAVEKTEVVFHNGSIRLAGTLVSPNTDQPSPALVVLHSASGASRNYHFYEHLTEVVPKLGISVLVFDRRGHGESSGNFRTADFDDLASDALAAVDFLASRPHIDSGRIGVWGVSQGGWIALNAAAQSPRIAFVISVSGPGVSPAEQMIYSAQTSIRQAGYPEVIVARATELRRQVDEYFRGNQDRLVVQNMVDRARDEPWFPQVYLPNRGQLPQDTSSSKWFHELDYDPIPVVAKVNVPTLFVFGELDRWVPVTTSIDKLTKATKSKEDITIVSIDGADHYLMIPPEQSVAEGEIQQISPGYLHLLQSWLQEHLER